MKEIRGDINTVFKEVLKDYMAGDTELCAYLQSIKTPDLTIEETVQLYSRLRYKIDGDVCIEFLGGKDALLMNDFRTITDEQVFCLTGFHI